MTNIIDEIIFIPSDKNEEADSLKQTPIYFCDLTPDAQRRIMNDLGLPPMPFARIIRAKDEAPIGYIMDIDLAKTADTSSEPYIKILDNKDI